MSHQAHEGLPPASHPSLHRLLPIAGIAVAVVAVLAHVLGLGAVLGRLGGGSIVVVVAVLAVKLLLVLGAGRRLRHGRWLSRRQSHEAGSAALETRKTP